MRAFFLVMAVIDAFFAGMAVADGQAEWGAALTALSVACGAASIGCLREDSK